MSEPNARLFKGLKLYCQVTAIAVMALGCVVLYGWTRGIEPLKTVFPGLVTMKVNTSVGMLLSGTSLWLLLPGASRTLRGHIARLLALLVALIGAATLTEYLFGLNLGIDQFLLKDPKASYGTTAPGLMAPTSAAAFLGLGLALILLDWRTRRGRRPTYVLSLLAGFIAMIAVCGYIYHASALYKLLLYTQMALHTAIAFLLLSIAVFFARPRTGIAGDLTGEGSGSVMARKALLAVVIIPLALGWVGLQGQYVGLYGTEFGLAMYATANVVIFAILVWLSARHMNKVHAQRRRAEIAIRQLNADLEVRVADRTKALEEQTTVLSEQAALLDLAHDAIYVRDMENRILFWNRGAETMYGWPAEMALGKITRELFKTEFSQPIAEIDAQLLRENHWEGEAIHYTRDGTRMKVSCRWALQRDLNGAPVRILSLVYDITARKAAEDALFAEKERAQVTLNSIGDAVICTDISGKVTFVNLVAERMTGWTWKEAAGRPMPEVFKILNAADRETIPNPMKLAVEQNRTMSLPLDCILIRRDGLEVPVEDSVSPIHNRDGKVTGAVIVFRDVSAARALTLQVTHTAQHDFLTGLPNRMLLNDRIAQAIALAPRHHKKVAVLFLDLDGFKHVNDSLGHSIGDKLLQSVAERLVTCVRGADTVSRQGGDEFVVLLSEMAQPEDAAISARRVLQAIAEPHLIDGHDLHVTCSIGVSVYPDDAQDAETLIKNADTAMYQAKENGHQTYRFFKSAMNERAVARQSIEEGLRRALERKELALVYQPIINISTGKITAGEALLRWTHPTRGPVSPAEFIPVAEDCGLILPIGKWALREACRQAQAWVEAGLSFRSISANISAVQFREEHFLSDVFSILQETKLNPHYLELELTESVLMKRAGTAEAVLAALKAKGVRVAIDDFGTGYSSLSYLRKFPLDALKIDQSFVRQITTSPDETSIVTAILSMARSLRLRVVAEGVETQAELLFLQAHNCEEAQGYYFSRPVPADQFAKLLASGIPEKVLVEV